MRRTLLVLVALLAVLAGCTAGPAGDATTPDTPAPDGTHTTTATDAGDPSHADGETTTDAVPSNDGGASASGGVDFYLSDRPSVIDEFDHLNVTVTRVGVHRAGADAGNGTGNGSEAGEWLEFDVNATADLTRLQGANASKLGTLDLPNGSYTKVFVYVSETEGVMDGERTRVKLPSGKLQLNKGFTVGDGESPSFVFDITVHKAGNSGKYILSPVVSESGTGDEVEIRDIDPEAEADDADESDADGEGVTTTTTVTPTTITPTTATLTTATAATSTTAETAAPADGDANAE